jgi:hypothetical protein
MDDFAEKFREELKRQSPYSCAECGEIVIVIGEDAQRSCDHTGAILANATMLAKGAIKIVT